MNRWSMAKNYWLIKSEPDDYSWDEFVRDGVADWTGVRNLQARNNLRAMKKGDQVFYYHSRQGLEIVGIARVVREAYDDPTASVAGKWSAVDFAPVRPLKRRILLAEVKAEEPLADMKLVRNPRLSVQPVTQGEWRYIMQMSRC